MEATAVEPEKQQANDQPLDPRSEEERKHEQLIENTKTMFANLADYLTGELQGRNLLLTFFYFKATSEDFLLLEKMNNVTKDKYVDMTSITKGLTSFMEDLQKKCNCTSR